MANVLMTHDMVNGPKGWRCVDCGRTGTITEINAVVCTTPTETKDRNVLDAIRGTGKFQEIK